MHALWKGAISFGLVNIPVKVYPATRHSEVRFTLLHIKCHTPLRFRRFCPECAADVPQEEVVRGYEYQDGRYVVLSEEDLAEVPGAPAHTVEILDFVDPAQIDPVYYTRAYYLEPQAGGGRAYALLRQAMLKTATAGVARVALRTKESLAAVRPHGPGLMLNLMHYPDEILPLAELAGFGELPAEASLGEKELAMAATLIQQLSGPFTPAKYENPTEDALRRLIEERLSGEPPEPPARRRAAAEVVDLLSALEASVAETKKGKKAPDDAPLGSVAGANVRRVGQRKKRR